MMFTVVLLRETATLPLRLTAVHVVQGYLVVALYVETLSSARPPGINQSEHSI